MSDNYQGPGRYRHYKGDEYEVKGLAVNEKSKDQITFDPDDESWQVVVYRPLTPGSLLHGTAATYWLRSLQDFNAMVDREHGPVPRFVREGDFNG